jgi:hypothetical protein
LTSGIDAYNHFGTIFVEPSATNILPVIACADVDVIEIRNNGDTLTLEAINGVKGIVASGNGVSVQSVVVYKLISKGGFTPFTSGSDGGQVFIGAVNYAEIGTLDIGGVDVEYLNNMGSGCLIGASVNSAVKAMRVIDTLNMRGLSKDNGSKVPPVLFGAFNGFLGNMALTAGSTVSVSGYYPDDSSSACIIGAWGLPNDGPFANRMSGILLQEDYSIVNISDYKHNPYTASLGGDFNNVYLNGKISLNASGHASAIIGRPIGSGKSGSASLAIGSSADIDIVSSEYVSVAVGTASKTAPIDQMVVENGARVKLSVTKPYPHKRYFNAEVAFGADVYARVNKVLIGATPKGYNYWEVLPGADNAAPRISLSNYPAIAGGPATINANVCARIADDADFYGNSRTDTTILGGNYIVQKASGALSAVPFTVSLTSDVDPKTLNTTGYNQYREALTPLLYKTRDTEIILT